MSDSLRPHGLQHSSAPSLSSANSRGLFKLTSIELVMPSNHLILCPPLLLPHSIFPSIRVFSNESVLRIRWPKYWNFSIGPSSEYSGLTSFRIDWDDLISSQGLSRVFSSTTVQKHQIFSTQLSFFFSFNFYFYFILLYNTVLVFNTLIPYSPTFTSIHDYWKNHGFG